MPIDQTCPDLSHWQRMLSDSSSSNEQEMLEEHLAGCLRCQGMVEALAVGKPHWASAVRQLAGAVTAAEPGLDRALDRLRNGGLGLTQRMHESSPDFSLAFLSPPKKPGYIGELGQYSISEVLGSGGMGIVLKAFDNVLQRYVALKVLASPLSAQKQHRQRFLREAQAAAAVSHEHVVTIHEIDEGDPYPFIVMQFVRGCSLQQRVAGSGPLEVKEILRIGLQIASGLAAAHKQGLIHRDIKPANILLENGVERVKITDFGLARTIEDVGLTQSGVVSGTPQYMAPEQARGEPLDHRADLFSLGSVLYFACTGKPPFQGRSMIGIVRSVADDQPIPLARLNPDVPSWLVAIIAKLHAKAPDDRYQTAAEVAEVLGARLARLQNPAGTVTPAEITVADHVVSPRPRLRTAERSSRRSLALVALLVVSIAIALLIAETTGVTHLASLFGPAAPTGTASNTNEPLGGSVNAASLSQSNRSSQSTSTLPDRVGTTAPVSPVRVKRHELAGTEVGETGTFTEKATRVVAAALSPDGTRALAAGGTDTAVLLWDVAQGKLVHRLEGHESWLKSVAFSPDGSRAVTGGGGSWQIVNGRRPGGDDFSVRVWNLDTKKELQAFRGHTLPVTGVAFTPDGKRVVSCSRDSSVRLWSIEGADEIRRFDGHQAEALCLAVSSHGSWVASGGWGAALLWDLETGQFLKRFDGHHGNVVAVAFSPDNNTLLTAGHDGSIRLFSVDSGKEFARFTGHTGRVLSAAFSPDGFRILSGGDDKTVRLWNVETRNEIHVFRSHTQAVNIVAFAPNDSQMAVSGAEDGTMRLWKLPRAPREGLE